MRVTVRNPGDSRPFEVEVTHDGAVVSTFTVTVAADETAEVELSVVFDEPRTGPVTVSGTEAGELTVASEDEPSPTPGPGTDGDGGLGPASLLLVALLGVLLARRRR